MQAGSRGAGKQPSESSGEPSILDGTLGPAGRRAAAGSWARAPETGCKSPAYLARMRKEV